MADKDKENYAAEALMHQNYSSGDESEEECILHIADDQAEMLAASDIKVEQEISHRKSTFPPINKWEGKYNFKLSVSYVNQKKSTECALFSRVQGKLFITKDFPFRTICNAQGVPAGSIIRATLHYLLPEDAIIPVTRCPMHIHEDLTKGNVAAEHVLQSLLEKAKYEKNVANGRFSVIVPYPDPEENNHFAILPFKLTCYSSCYGGISRRPLIISFSLENNGVQLGRQMLEVKICACPTRDMKQEQMKHIQSYGSQKNLLESAEREYSIETEDPKLYRFLLLMKELYESNNFIKYQLNATAINV